MKIEPIDEKYISPAFIYIKGDEIKCLHYIQAAQHDKQLKSEGWKHTATVEPIEFIQNILNDPEYLNEFRQIQAVKYTT